jgi:hypothetical protein
VTTCSFEKRLQRAYDLQLDHWGFRRPDGQSYHAVRAAIAPKVAEWYAGPHNGLYDCSLRGAEDLRRLAPDPSRDVYYFTLSFCATDAFPGRHLTAEDVNGFLGLFPLVWNPLGLLGHVTAPAIRAGMGLGAVPSLRAAVGWMVRVANRHLGALGYFSEIPAPGSHVPRPDMLALIKFPGYAIAGRDIPDGALPGISSEDFRLNDGIVNTRSMDGPVGDHVRDGGGFAAAYAAGTDVKGQYWHLGLNRTMDHADQIGVFTSDVTVRALVLGDLLPRVFPVSLWMVGLT